MTWLTLALLCALSLAAADTASKRWLSHLPAGTLILVRTALPGVLLLPGLAWVDFAAIPAVFWPWLAVVLPLDILAMSLYTRAIHASPLSHTLPYMAFTPVFTVATGFLLLGERVSPTGLAGILLVAAGAWGLNLEHAGWHPRTWFAPFAAIVRQRGARLMLAVAAIYSVTSVLGKGALGYLPPMEFVVLYFVSLSVGAFAWFAWREPEAVRGTLHAGGYAWLVGGLLAVMALSHFAALALAQTAYMIAVKRTSVLFGIVLGAWLLREDRVMHHLGAASLMVAGVALIVA